jgi:hypothetical protein
LPNDISTRNPAHLTGPAELLNSGSQTQLSYISLACYWTDCVADVPWVGHDSRFSRACKDIVVYDATRWRAADKAYVRVAIDGLRWVDVLSGLIAISTDHVKHNKERWYLM